jgi:hypothetical protein
LVSGEWLVLDQTPVSVEVTKPGYRSVSIDLRHDDVHSAGKGLVKVELQPVMSDDLATRSVADREAAYLGIPRGDPDFYLAQMKLAQLYALQMHAPVRAKATLEKLLEADLRSDPTPEQAWYIKYLIALIVVRWPGEIAENSVSFELQNAVRDLENLQVSPFFLTLDQDQQHQYDYTLSFAKALVTEGVDSWSSYVEKYSKDPKYQSYVLPVQSKYMR